MWHYGLTLQWYLTEDMVWFGMGGGIRWLVSSYMKRFQSWTIMDFHGLSWGGVMTGMDDRDGWLKLMTGIDDWHGWLAWMTGMDDKDGWLGWMTGMDDWNGWLGWMTGMDDWHGWLGWMTGMDDWHWWLAWMTGMDNWILTTRVLTDGLTDGRTMVLVKSLLKKCLLTKKQF